VTRVVWLASYPKSGNTWFRLLAANLSAGDEPVDINAIGENGGIASGRAEFESHTLLDSGLLTHDEADILRPRVYERLSGDGDGSALRLVKAHDAYLTTPLAEPLLAGSRGAERAILIVRDPRDVAGSLANHRRISLDAAIDFMADRTACFAATTRGQSLQLRQRLLDWSGHAASWLGQTDLPVHLLRYEDLQAAPLAVFVAAMAFAGRQVAAADAERAIEFARFERLQVQERDQGFVEWRPRGRPALFFRRGESQAWRDELTAEQVQRIESAHGPMMRRLGYPLSATDQGVQRAV
jgi:aryl sulfotransferase